jgi:hypothetical protein
MLGSLKLPLMRGGVPQVELTRTIEYGIWSLYYLYQMMNMVHILAI